MGLGVALGEGVGVGVGLLLGVTPKTGVGVGMELLNALQSVAPHTVAVPAQIPPDVWHGAHSLDKHSAEDK